MVGTSNSQGITLESVDMPKFGLWIIQKANGDLTSYASNPGGYILGKATSCHYVEVHNGRIVDLTDYGDISSNKSEDEK